METEMTLADEFLALSPEQRRSVHFVLCQHALDKWASYTATRDKIRYAESVAGTQQEVDKQLPFDSFDAAKKGIDVRNVAERYREPIVALQDEDLEFSESITFAYYAIYNLFRKYVKQDVIDDWLIVNQALSTEDDSEIWNVLLRNAIQMSKQ